MEPPAALRARLGWPEDRVCGTADGRPVHPAQLKLRTLNFGQHWRTEGIAEVDYALLVPRGLLAEEMAREHEDFVADSMAHPTDDPFEQALRDRAWPSVSAVLADDAVLGMAAAWYGVEILGRWLGYAWPEGALPTAERPWFVLNTAAFGGRDGDLLRFEGRARRGGDGRALPGRVSGAIRAEKSVGKRPSGGHLHPSRPALTTHPTGTRMKEPSLTLGIEEEYQIVDPETRELRSYITELLEDDHMVLGEIKPELHQSIVEVGTNVCHTPQEVRSELRRLRGMVMGLAARKNLKVVAAGTHPFSSWMTQEITPLERYIGVKQDMQDLAQQLLIFGTHVHVGIEDREFLIDAMNVSRYFLPHLLCLSSSSPFWMGRHTGLKSYRSVIFRNFPRTGVPRIMRSWGDFDELMETLVQTRCIPDGSKIYWDLRPHHAYPTLEFRFLDVCTRVEEAVCIAALLQAIIKKLWKLRRDNMTFRVYGADLIEENKWRAVRYGMDGNLIDFGKQKECPARSLIREMLEWFVDDVVDDLGTRKEVDYAFRIMDEGSSADRQIAVFQKTGDLKAVVDHLIAESAEGVLEPAVS